MKLKLLASALLATSMAPLLAGNSSSKQKHKIASKEILKARAQKINGVAPLEKVEFFNFFDNNDLTDAEIKDALDRILINLYKNSESLHGVYSDILLTQVEPRIIKKYSPLKPLLYAVLFDDNPELRLQTESYPIDFTEELKKLK